jgi:hypothetical protein
VILLGSVTRPGTLAMGDFLRSWGLATIHAG